MSLAGMTRTETVELRFGTTTVTEEVELSVGSNANYFIEVGREKAQRKHDDLAGFRTGRIIR